MTYLGLIRDFGPALQVCKSFSQFFCAALGVSLSARRKVFFSG